MTVYGFGKYQTQRRATERTYAPHEEADLRSEDLKGLIVDHIDGVVAEDLIERTQDAVASDFWSLQ